MRIQSIGIFIFLLIVSSMSFGEVDSDEIFYTNHSDKVFRARTSLESIEETQVHFFPGLPFLWIEQKIDKQGVLWMRLGLENINGVEGESTNDIWIRADDFATLDVMEDTVARMTYCYRYVKRYLLSKGFVDVYLPGASAYMAAEILPKHGFSKTSRTPAQASTYDVCVYKGGPSGHGHIEVLDPKGWYYGYGYKAHPIKNRIFISCFYKKINTPLP